jgi:Arc/MetJ-type ribon-helix-helix transcriptional regulator
MPSVELEKVCINITAAEIGQIDLLVARGLFTSRTDLIRAGIREVLAQHEQTLTRVAQGSTGLGYLIVTREDLEASRERGERQRMFVIGVLRLEDSITPDLADAAIERIQILGSLRASKEVLERLGTRVVRGLPSGM